MHIIRVPSYNPPAFDAEEPPPPLETPPPQYDSIASPTTGLADYFARLSDAYTTEGESSVDDDEEDGAATPRARGSLVFQEIRTADDNEGSTIAAAHAPVGNWI
jgi:arrestin-related trafficking adapter 3/6